MPFLGKGKRYFTARLRETRGLKDEVGVPCLVSPKDPQDIWVDWDAGYDLHCPVWDRELAVERAVEERKGGIEAIAGKIFSPFRPGLDPADEGFVEEAIAKEQAITADEQRIGALMVRAINQGGFFTPDAEEHATVRSYARWADHLHRVGIEAPATVVSLTPTATKLVRTPVYELHLDVDDTPPGAPPRRVVHHEVMGDGWALRMGAGTATTVHVDPTDPNRIALAPPDTGLDATGGVPGFNGYVERHERLKRVGRKATATIVAAGPTGGTLYTLPEWAITLDVVDGGTVRRVVHHEPMGRKKSPWKVGMTTSVRIDPDDPDELTFG